MASNVFYQFDVGKQNIMSNYDFSNHSQRQNGVGTGAALSSLHNKLFYQVSTITSALAEVMKNNGYDMGSSVESSWATTVTQLSNIVTKAFLTANHYTKTETQSYVTGLLALYDLSTVVDEKISAAISGIGGGAGSEVTIGNVKSAIEAAFSITQETILGVTFGAYKATYSEVDTGTDPKKYVTPASIKDSSKVPHGTPTEGNVFLGNGSKWESKPKSSLGFLSSTDLSAYAVKTEVYTKTELNGGQLDTRYYTEAELNAGQLDSRYFNQTAANNRFLQAVSIMSNKVESGYILIPSGSSGGICIQWGKDPSTINDDNTHITSLNYSGKTPWTVICTNINTSVNSSLFHVIQIVSISGSSFTWMAQQMHSDSVALQGFYWVAIGEY